MTTDFLGSLLLVFGLVFFVTYAIVVLVLGVKDWWEAR